MFSVELIGDISKWIDDKNKELQKKMEAKVVKATLQVEQETKANLRPHVSSGGLIRDYSSNFEGKGFNKTGQVGTSKNYGPSVEKGSRPHTPPIAALERWAKQRGVPVGAIWHKIRTKGTEPHPHLEPAANDVLTDFDWSI